MCSYCHFLVWGWFCISFSSLVFLDYISPFNICCKACLVVLNSLYFCSSDKLFISPSVLNEILARYSNLGCRFFTFSTLNIPCHSLLACKDSAERSAVKHMGFPLYVTCCFFLAAFHALSLCLVFVSLISMCLGMFLLGFILYGILCASWTWLTISSSMLGKFSTIFSSNIFLYSFFFSSSSSAAAAKLPQSCPTLHDLTDGSSPSSPIPGILQARILEWVAISFSNAWKWKVKVKSLSRVWLFATPWAAAYQAPPPWYFPGKSTGVGCHRLLHSLL